MQDIATILKSDMGIIIMMTSNLLIIIVLLITIIKFSKINKKYKKFMEKLGNGSNIEEDLENYMYRVERVEKQNAQISGYIKSIDEDLEKSIQKIGIFRYNAFKDTGSDLSFALALLDQNNNGIVLNGIYSREMSNIYAKPIENGKSVYTMSSEEQEAINRAIASNEIKRIK